MSCSYAFPAARRGIIRLTGADRVDFLQGLVSNDVRRVSSTKAIWAALLTPQGRYLHDFFVMERDDALLIDVEAERLEDLMRRLKLYKLRAKVIIEHLMEFDVAVAWGKDAGFVFGLDTEGAATLIDGVLVIVDPRLAALGARLVGPSQSIADLATKKAIDLSSDQAWTALRLSLGVPGGLQDLLPEKSLLLENGFDELNGVAWDKGCYVGQELTARTKYRGLVKKRLLPVRIEGPQPLPGTIITSDGQEAGEMRSGQAGFGMALLRIDALNEVLMAAETRLLPVIPEWLKLAADTPISETKQKIGI